MIKINESKTDRILRIFLGFSFLFFGLFYFTNSIKVFMLIFGSILIVTGVTGFCGLYSFLGISTCPTKTKKAKNKSLDSAKN